MGKEKKGASEFPHLTVLVLMRQSEQQYEGVQKKRLYPDISALVYNAVTLHIEELRSPVGDGAALGCPVLDGHGFSGSFHLNSGQFH